METVRGHARAFEASRQLCGEEDVRELGLAVASESPPTVGAFSIQVVERDVRTPVGIRGGGDDASRCALLQPVDEQVGEEERCQVVDGPGLLDAVLGEPALRIHRPRVVDQDVEPRAAVENLGGEPAHRPLRGEVGDEHVDPRVASARGLDPDHGLGRSRLASGNDAELGPEAGKLLSGGQSDPVGGAGDEDPFSPDTRPLRHCFSITGRPRSGTYGQTT